MNIQEIEIAQITTDGGTESRALNQQVVTEYAEVYKADPKKLPPPDVFFDGTHYWAGDGFHRLEAAKVAGLKTIQVNVREGGRIEALKHSLGSNDEHGYRRTAEDKRYAIRKALAEFPDHSSRMIAKWCRVSHNFVNELRGTVLDDSQAVSDGRRVGGDGVVRKMPRKPQAGQVGNSPVQEPEGDSQVASEVSDLDQAGSAALDEEFSPAPTQTPDITPTSLDEALNRLKGLCERVLKDATEIMAEHPRSSSAVRTCLNILRSNIDRFTKVSLPKKEALKCAA